MGHRRLLPRAARPDCSGTRDFAATTAHGGVVAPEDFNPFAWMAAGGGGVQGSRANDPQATEKTLGVDPSAVGFQVNGGI